MLISVLCQLSLCKRGKRNVLLIIKRPPKPTPNRTLAAAPHHGSPNMAPQSHRCNQRAAHQPSTSLHQPRSCESIPPPPLHDLGSRSMIHPAWPGPPTNPFTPSQPRPNLVTPTNHRTGSSPEKPGDPQRSMNKDPAGLSPVTANRTILPTAGPWPQVNPHRGPPPLEQWRERERESVCERQRGCVASVYLRGRPAMRPPPPPRSFRSCSPFSSFSEPAHYFL